MCWDQRGTAIFQKIPKGMPVYQVHKMHICIVSLTSWRSWNRQKSSELPPEKLGLGLFLPP